MRTPTSVHASVRDRHICGRAGRGDRGQRARRGIRGRGGPFRPGDLVALLASALLHATAVPAVAETDPVQRRRTPVVEVFEATRNAVVNISTTQVIERVDAPRGFGSLFDELFPRPRVRRYRSESVGSGFVLHADGYIVTNYHVVARTAERKVIFADKREYDADVVATDMQRDLAVLKIQAHHALQPLPLGRSNDLMVGETVIAIGNPLGYQHTVTAGVVSALERQIDVERGFQFTNLIQTDASINPGNSGGPLLNVLGELVGITTAIRADAENIGFAIPVDGLREVLPDMLSVERRYGFQLGITVANVEEATVTATRAGSPAGTAGVRVGDVVSAVDDTAVTSGIDFHIALIGRRAGESITLHLQRTGQPLVKQVTLAEMPQPEGGSLLQACFGLEVEPMHDRTARRLGFRRPFGLVITAVERGGPADRAGLRAGHVILHLGRFQVRRLDEVGHLLAAVQSGQRVRLDVLQAGGGRLVRRIVMLTAR